ncbi:MULTISPECIES: hypothetical protein [Natrialbaceae]|uniref:hypothetical protein n=1 Tax=Natrialbaceae TaxID=1644061 RepID=UPI00207CFDCA|nr:hypothetical protein [Natronococcus sp. CG52]
MDRNSFRPVSRRTFAKYGLLTAGTVSGVSGATASDGHASNEVPREGGSNESTAIAERGVMLPYQFVPDSRFAVVERDLAWQPASLESTSRTHVIRYEHSPSFRAFLFTGTPLRSGRSFALGEALEFPTDTDRHLVSVGVEGLESTGSDAQ